MSAYVGTTHSFADRLLRLRPVEALLSPPYEIAEDDEALVRAVFDEFVALAAPVREAPWGPIGSRKPRPLCGGCAAVTTRCKYPARSGGSWLLRLRKRRPGNIPSPGITRHGRCGRPIAIAFETTCVRRSTAGWRPGSCASSRLFWRSTRKSRLGA